jgi:hypothetical protein
VFVCVRILFPIYGCPLFLMRMFTLLPIFYFLTKFIKRHFISKEATMNNGLSKHGPGSRSSEGSYTTFFNVFGDITHLLPKSALLRPMTIYLVSLWWLRVSWYLAPSLTRGRVCNLLYNCFWALPEQSLLGRSPAEVTAIFYSHLRLSKPGGPGSCIYIPQEQGGPVVPPCTGFPFCHLLRGILTLLHMGRMHGSP